MIREKFQFQVGQEVYNESIKFLDYMYKHSGECGFSLDFYDFVAKICEICKESQKD